MPFINSTQSYFSNNMEDLVFATNTEDAYLGVFFDDILRYKLTPINGKITLRTAEIVNSLLDDYNPHIDTRGIVQEAISQARIFVSADFSSSQLNFPAIKGGYNRHRITDEDEFLMHNFLTWRPQTIYTTHGIKEQLTVASVRVATENVISFEWKICARLYFCTKLPTVITIAAITEKNALCRIDVSADTISAKAAETGISDEITAYDIYGELRVSERNDKLMPNITTTVYENAPYAQRFVIVPPASNRTYFFFQNTLGGFDTIAASGSIKNAAKGDIKTATNNRIEKEVANDFIESWEVNTGYIATAQEKNHWHEFLRATNRYVLLPDGSYREIIVDEYKAEYTHSQLGSFTFKYHYSTPDYGAYFVRQELDEFENDII